VKKKILVFPCGSEIALEIYKAVNYSSYFELIGASSVSDHGKFVFEDYIEGIPFVDDPNFIMSLQKIIKEKAIDAVYPTMDSVIARLSSVGSEQLGCKIVAPPSKTTEICLSKVKTYRCLKNIVKVPMVYNAGEMVPFPVFCKPDVGYSSRGVKKINNADELKAYLNERPDCLILEYLPGEEYTVDCFTDRKGHLLFCGPRKRARITNGISVNTFPMEDNGEFIHNIKKLNDALAFRGAWFAQFKRDNNGELVIMEIAGRFGGSSSLYRGLGVNFPLLSLFDCFEYEVKLQMNHYRIEMDRALDNKYHIEVDYDEIFVDYDDTIILDTGKYNLDVVKFIFQCRNEGKKISLLTSHEGDLGRSLEQYHLNGLFDRIIHISKKECKADYIDNESSIFIDDSFAERMDVSAKKKIPVFSVDMVETLLK